MFQFQFWTYFSAISDFLSQDSAVKPRFFNFFSVTQAHQPRIRVFKFYLAWVLEPMFSIPRFQSKVIFHFQVSKFQTQKSSFLVYFNRPRVSEAACSCSYAKNLPVQEHWWYENKAMLVIQIPKNNGQLQYLVKHKILPIWNAVESKSQWS